MEQKYFTLKQLIEMWLEKHPKDLNSYNLMVDACAGYVRTERGYVWGREYFGEKKASGQ